MIEIRQTAEFSAWLKNLSDGIARARIAARLQRLSTGHLGDARAVGDRVSELRIHIGPGYRVYFVRNGSTVLLLLTAGDKSSQSRDIERAKRLARELKV